MGTGEGNGFNFGKAVDRRLKLLDALERENARRVKCPHCVLMILPEGMERHVRICHTARP